MTQSPGFETIGLIGKPKSNDSEATFMTLINFLKKKKRHVIIEKNTAALFEEIDHIETVSSSDLGEKSDLVIVVGGDGSLLNAARNTLTTNTPVVGVNRGGLGFLTDIQPSRIEEQIGKVLLGDFIEEPRFLLQTRVKRDNEDIGQATALNDCVLYSGNIARMIEFEVYVNNDFVYSQRSDGLITATPTGSTAYALSGGGPILAPSLHAIVLVPMHPHTLSSRPIVVHSDSEIKLVVANSNTIYPMLSCDGQTHIACAPGDEISISKHPRALRLIHPSDHDYYNVLRGKLGWGTKLV